LGFAEYGVSGGQPVFYFHGHPGSRLDWPGLIHDAIDVELNARVIAVDRPGHGLSDFYPDRKLLDWPDDVVELADALSLDRFSVLGVSGGGPYAAACAFKIPERLNATAIVCGMGPVESPGCKDGLSWVYAGKGSLRRRLLLLLTSTGLQKQPDKFIAAINEGMSGPDKALVLGKPELVKNIASGFSEAFSPGIAGVHLEAELCNSPWGFRLEDISAEVHLWHGEQDDNVLVSVGRYVADTLPNCRATFVKEEGHLSLIHNCVREYLSVLVV